MVRYKIWYCPTCKLYQSKIKADHDNAKHRDCEICNTPMTFEMVDSEIED